jgi:hypothetical protein
MDVEEKETGDVITIHLVHLMRSMGTGIEKRQQIQEQLEAENNSIAISTQVRWLPIPRTIMERSQK